MRVDRAGIAHCSYIQHHDHGPSGFWEFHYFLEGTGVFVNADMPLQVEPGMIFLSLSGEAHSYRSQDPGQKAFIYWLRFDPTSGDEELAQALLGRFGSKRAINAGTGLGLAFEDIRRRTLSDDPLIRRGGEHRVSALVCDLAAQPERGVCAAAEAYVHAALRYMQANFGRELTLEDLSAKLGIDKSYFVRIFKKAVGSTPMRYYLDLRLEAARNRLSDSRDPLRSIAAELGFRDEFHFSHQFKRYAGCSPREWRLQHQRSA